MYIKIKCNVFSRICSIKKCNRLENNVHSFHAEWNGEKPIHEVRDN